MAEDEAKKFFTELFLEILTPKVLHVQAYGWGSTRVILGWQDGPVMTKVYPGVFPIDVILALKADGLLPPD